MGFDLRACAPHLGRSATACKAMCATINRYYDKTAVEADVRAGKHRECVGGLWDEIGRLQLDFLISRGLREHHRVLDIGCGSLRAGVKLVKHLRAGHYAGSDLNESLLTAGYEI